MSQLSEEELSAEIIHMHDVLHLGYRRIAKELLKQGYEVNKDSVNQLYGKFKVNDDTGRGEDKALIMLRAAETRTRQRVELRKQKQKLRRQIVAL